MMWGHCPLLIKVSWFSRGRLWNFFCWVVGTGSRDVNRLLETDAGMRY